MPVKNKKDGKWYKRDFKGVKKKKTLKKNQNKKLKGLRAGVDHRFAGNT